MSDGIAAINASIVNMQLVILYVGWHTPAVLTEWLH